jgi:hypothetical protein
MAIKKSRPRTVTIENVVFWAPNKPHEDAEIEILTLACAKMLAALERLRNRREARRRASQTRNVVVMPVRGGPVRR